MTPSSVSAFEIIPAIEAQSSGSVPNEREPIAAFLPDDTSVTLAAAEGKPLVQYTYHGAALACHHIAGRLCGRRVPLMKITNR